MHGRDMPLHSGIHPRCRFRKDRACSHRPAPPRLAPAARLCALACRCRPGLGLCHHTGCRRLGRSGPRRRRRARPRFVVLATARHRRSARHPSGSRPRSRPHFLGLRLVDPLCHSDPHRSAHAALFRRRHRWRRHPGRALPSSPALALTLARLAAAVDAPPALALFVNSSLIPVDNIPALIDNYLGSTLVPSRNGFWAWFAATHGPATCLAHGIELCNLEFRPPYTTDDAPALALAFGAPALAVPLTPTCAAAIDDALTAAATSLKSAFPALADYDPPVFDPHTSSVDAPAAAAYLAGTLDLDTLAWLAPPAHSSLVRAALSNLSAPPSGSALYTSANITCSPAGAVAVRTLELTSEAEASAGFSWASLAKPAAPVTDKLVVDQAGAAQLATALAAATATLTTSDAYAWASGRLGPTPTVLGLPIVDLLGDLHDTLTSSALPSISARSLDALLDAAIANSPVALHANIALGLTGSPAAPVLSLDLVQTSVFVTVVETPDAPWASVLDLSRIPVHLLATHTLAFSSAAPTAVKLTVAGSGSAHSFAAPASWHMSAAAVTSGSLTLDLDLPAASSLVVTADAVTDGLAGSMLSMRVSIVDSDLTAMDNAALVNGSVPLSSDAAVDVVGYPHYPPTAAGAASPLHASGPVASLLPTLSATPPKDVLAALANTISSVATFASGSAAFPLPILGKGINAIDAVAAALEPIFAKLTWAGELEPQLMYATLCLDAPLASHTESYSMSVNGLAPASCSFKLTQLTPANLPTAVEAAVAAGLAGCALPGHDGLSMGSFVAASTSPAFSQDSATCTVLSLKPAVPGIVRAFTMTASSDAHFLTPYATTWSESSVPVFARWDDLVVRLAQTGINALVHLPLPLSVEATSLPSLSAGPISLDLPASTAAARVAAWIDTDVAIVHGCAPLRSSANITIETAFVNGSATDDYPTARVPLSGGGFQLSAKFVVRSAEPGVPPKSVEVAQYLAFRPGALVADQLLSSLLPQITDVELAGVLAVRLIAPDPILNPGSPQVEIAINAAINPETQHLVIPYSLSISNITLPGLEYAAPVMSQSRAVVRDLEVGLATAASFHAGKLDGAIGPLGVEIGSVAAKASASLILHAASPWLTTATALKAGSQPTSLFSAFTLDAAVAASAVVGGMAVDAFAAPIPGLPHLTVDLSVADAADLASPAALQQFKDNLQAQATATWSGDDALIRMLKGLASKDASMCELLKAGVDFLADVKADPSVQTPLAPMKHSPFGRVLAKLLPMYDDTVAAVCDRGEPMSLALFCSFMADAFHYQVGPVCSNVSLAHETFKLPLTFTPYTTSYTDASVMDTQLFHGGGSLSAGVSASNNLAVSAQVDVALVLDVTFPASGPVQVALDKDATYLRASAGAHDDGQLKLQFGPYTAEVAKSRAWLAASADVGDTAPATLTASPGTGVTLAGSAGFDAAITFPFVDSAQCEVSVVVPSLAHPSDATASDAKCADFVANLDAVLSKSWMAEFFSHPGTFFSSFSTDLAKLRAQMFGPDSILGSKAIAFIDKKLATLFDGELSAITGPAVASQIIHQISVDLVDKLAGIPVSTTVDEIVVEIVTGALNAHLPHLAQPVTVAHDAQARSYTWSIEFGNSALRPLFSVNSDWGAHGLLDLDIQCNAQLEADWTFSIALVYSAVHGVSVTLPVEPAFSSTVDLDMPSGCQLVGGLGPLGFELITTPADTYLKGTLALTLLPKADIDIDISAQLGGKGLMGAGPLIADLAHTTPQEALTAFIHYEASFKAGYEFDIKAGQTSTTPTKLALNDVEMCLGTMLVKYIDAMMGHVTKILDPLNKVFGPNGVLLKPIPGMSKIFGSNFNALRVARFFCELTSDCNIDQLVTAIRVYGRIMNVVAVADELSSLGVEGCGVSKLLGSFELALHKPVLVPDGYLPPKTQQILYNSAVAQAHEKEIASFVSGVTTSGSFGIEYNILHNPVEKLLDMMMGTNFAIVGVTIPDATLALGMHFPIPIWPFPHVVLSLDFKAALTVSVGEVSLTYDAVYESIHYKNPSYLFRGLGVTYTNPDGSPHYPLIFTASMTGEVSVGVFIFKGYGYAGLQIDVSIRLNNPNGGEVITFDQIARLVKHGNLMHSLDGGIVLTFKYGLGIKACVHLVFVHKCWTVVHWDGSHVVFTDKFNPQSVPAVSSGAGAINLGLVDPSMMLLSSSAMPTYTIDDAGNGMLWFAFVVPGQPVGEALPTRGVTAATAKVVTFAGSASGAFRVVPRSATPVALPSVAAAHVELPMAYHAPASGTPTYVASALKVSAAGGAGASLGKTCGSVSLTEPVDRAVIAVQGAVCPVSVSVASATNVTVSGALVAYGGHGVSLSGSGGDTLTIDVVTDAIRIEAATVMLGASSELAVALAADGLFSRLQLKGSPSLATTFTVAAAPVGTATSAAGGDGDDIFEVADLAALGSLVTVNGAGGDANSLSVTLAKDATFADVMADFVLGGFDSAPSRGVGFGNIQTLNVNVHASANKKTVGLYVAAPVSGTTVNLHGISSGAPDATLTYDLRGCTRESALNVFPQGGGKHTVILGNGALTLTDYECEIKIVSADADNVVELHMMASHDTRELQYAVTDSGVVVTNGKTAGLRVTFVGDVNRARILLGVGGSRVSHKLVSAVTEVLYASVGPANLAMAATSAAVIANGTIDIAFGEPGSGKHPLAAIHAPVFVGTAEASLLTLATATGPDAIPQWFDFAAHRVCRAAPQSGVPQRPQIAATPWATALATVLGVPAGSDGKPACQLAYAASPARYVMNVTTGGGRDGLLGAGVSNVVLHAATGGGIDLLTWLKSGDAAQLDVDLGEGVDFANFEGPLNSDARIAVGGDAAADVVVFWAPEEMAPLAPSLLKGDSVVPSGFGMPAPRLVVSHLTTKDSMSLLRGTPDMSAYPWLAGYFGGSPAVVNVTTPVGGHLDFDLVDGETMEVVQLPLSSQSTFAAASASQPGKVARNWVLDLALSSVAEPTVVAVNGEAGSNGTVVVTLPLLPAGASYMVAVHDLGYGGYGRVVVGGLRLTVQHVDVVVIDTQAAAGTVVDVANAPLSTGLDSAIVVVGAGNVVLPAQFAFPVLISGGAVDATSGALVTAAAPIWLVGQTTTAQFVGSDAVDLDGPCLSAHGAVSKSSMPAAVIRIAGLAPVPVAQASGCGAGLFGVESVAMAAANLTATRMAAGANVALLNATHPAAQVVLADTQLWSAVATEVGGAEAVTLVTRDDGTTFAIATRASAALRVHTGVVADDGTLELACFGVGTRFGLEFMGASAEETSVSVSGAGCRVTLGSTTAGVRNVPATIVSSAAASDVVVDVAATVWVAGAETSAVDGRVVVVRGSGARAVDVQVARPGSAMFGAVQLRVVGSGTRTTATSEDRFLGKFARSLPSVVFEPRGSGAELQLVNARHGAATGVVVEAGLVKNNGAGVLSIDYCGESGCGWSCYSSSQCTARQLRADAVFGGPCRSRQELSECADAAQWRVVGGVSAEKRRDGLLCKPFGDLTFGVDAESGSAKYDRALMGFVVASAVACVILTLGALVYAERGLDYGLGQVFGDRFGWARFVVFALVSRSKLPSWAPATVDVVAAGYQAVANLGGVQCTAVEPSPDTDALWRKMSAGLVGAAAAGTVAIAIAHVMARQRRYSAWIVASIGRVFLGLAAFALAVPALAHGLESAGDGLLVGCGVCVLGLGVLGDAGRTRLRVVMAGAHVALDDVHPPQLAAAVLTYGLSLGAAFSAAALDSSASARVSLVLWSVALAGELVAPAWNMLQGGQRLRHGAVAAVGSLISGILGGVALHLLDAGGSVAVVALWAIAFWGQWLVSGIVLVRGRTLDGSVVRERGKGVRRPWLGGHDEHVGLLDGGGLLSEVSESEPALN
ncbi:uncharacterized protein AMSG_10070 [Thecamonas trahens ATCC 50062]|uniref:Uncharacterized protein n=1 Tax=Thecamonas trahens ATCC 50062 TaxID=461836 RepID=A0A0L0DQG8_THETB|nr:hypothetical protein AMSG_10070 [Thecamonas trahens ATCC 50062]KNC54271.1 hypothetical protein AMSG_10070 [Thecamonas trahens ATCC 50062]|eukprot:XP_013753903.1 hypothetical protein AMSG_10070 [Thecamonas trahens ATCC 50062]